jgi:hypothetical protein
LKIKYIEIYLNIIIIYLNIYIYTMDEQFTTRKLTIGDLIDDGQPNNNNKGYSYKIENNQKKYSAHQKCKP